MKRKASAEWKGSLKDGKGSVSTESGVLAQAQYSFNTRFESGIGTNPEELVAAAHAACFSMQLSALIGKARLVPEQIATSVQVNCHIQWNIRFHVAIPFYRRRFQVLLPFYHHPREIPLRPPGCDSGVRFLLR